MCVDLLADVLPVIGSGYLGVFIVTSIIVFVVSLLNKFTNK